MSNQRLYTNKAMAIGAVIDALDCDLNDLTDVYMLTQNRLVDAGVIVPDDQPIDEIGMGIAIADHLLSSGNWAMLRNSSELLG